MRRKRDWEQEDLDQLDTFIDAELADGSLSVPGLESIRDQIALRLGQPTRFKDHDAYRSPGEAR